MQTVIFSNYPNSIEALNNLLESCSCENMSSFQNCLYFGKKELEGKDLPFELFQTAIIYPIQCYPMDKDQKARLCKNICRLYPAIFPVNPQAQPLLRVLKDLKLSPESPLAVQSLDSFIENLSSVSVDTTKAALTPQLIYSIKEKICELNKQTKTTLINILNFIRLERGMFQAAWRLVQCHEISIKMQQEISNGRPYILLAPGQVRYIDPNAPSERSQPSVSCLDKIKSFEKQLTTLCNSSTDETQNFDLFFRWLSRRFAKHKTGDFEISLENIINQLEINYHTKKLSDFCNKMFRLLEGDKKLKNQAQHKIEWKFYTSYCSIGWKFLIKLTDAMVKEREKLETFSWRLRDFTFEELLYKACHSYKLCAEEREHFYGELYQELIGREKENKRQKELPEKKLPPFELEPIESISATFNQEILKHLLQLSSAQPAKKKQRSQKPISEVSEKGATDESSAMDSEEVLDSAFEEIETPTEFVALNYATRVYRWFEALEHNALNPALFPEYATSDSNYREEMIIRHAFSRSVDCFIEKFALKMEKPSKFGQESETHYLLPGQIKTSEKVFQGAFVYCRNNAGLFYHRFFSTRPFDEVARDTTEEALYHFNFPPLALEVEKSDSAGSLKISQDPNESIVQHNYLRVVKITNVLTKLEWTLIPVVDCN